MADLPRMLARGRPAVTTMHGVRSLVRPLGVELMKMQNLAFAYVLLCLALVVGGLMERGDTFGSLACGLVFVSLVLYATKEAVR